MMRAFLPMVALVACHRATPWTPAPTVEHTLTFEGRNEGFDVQVDLWLPADVREAAASATYRGWDAPEPVDEPRISLILGVGKTYPDCYSTGGNDHDIPVLGRVISEQSELYICGTFDTRQLSDVRAYVMLPSLGPRTMDEVISCKVGRDLSQMRVDEVADAIVLCSSIRAHRVPVVGHATGSAS
jgi:hypothetical protein